MGKANYVCEYGVTHSTANCRCMSDHVSTRQVKCDVPDEHSIKPLRGRLEGTIDSFFGSIIMPVVRDSLLDKLEQDVSEWLIEAAKTIKE